MTSVNGKFVPGNVLGLLDDIAASRSRISVIGSMNVDYTVTTKRLPKPGETVNGGPLTLLPGGKSANQASAAARIGACRNPALRHFHRFHAPGGPIHVHLTGHEPGS